MKDYIKQDLKKAASFEDVKDIIGNYIYYYNNDRYQWDLAKLSPNEYYAFVTTEIYPLDVSNAPKSPAIRKKASDLGEHSEPKCNNEIHEQR